ncbi:putative transcriptional regulatory protein [metagenome]|uniref:Putative transcriptional regulatory protein n=1 Tax=metagenome TaxID=256318 RepID=A0A2P2CFG4_9ZZZZ
MTHDAMRAEVADSWHRSAAAGVLADKVEAPITLPDDDLHDYRQEHPLSRVFPLLDDVLGQAARDCDAVMAVSDAAGQLLWVCGTPATLRRAESIGFVEGSNWDERLAGTNAPGLALRLDQPVNVIRSEHFRQSVQQWSCAATPIHDPGSSSLLGVLDITGGDQIVVPQTMAMVRAAARMAEAELARDRLTVGLREQRHEGFHVVMESLGRSEALLGVDDGRGHRANLRLSPRHSEILLLLASAPRGLSGDELAVLLYEDDSPSSTLRAEFNRLRHLLGDELLASRPYRLAAGVTADWLAVEAHLAAGDLRAAMRAYSGPVLPRSTAPGVVRLRENLENSLRRALLRSGEADLMSTWTRSAWGTDDYEMWSAQRDAVGTSSPMLALIDGQIARLDRELL